MRTLPFIGLLTAALLLVYGPGLSAPLVFDDHDALTKNPSIRALSTALSPPPQTPVAGRPLPNLTFALGYALGGLAPSVHRAPSLLLHLCNALLALWLVSTLLARPVVPEALRSRRRGLAQASALLFLLHPLGSEAVMYVTQRTEQLAATLYLATLACAVKALELAHGVRDDASGDAAVDTRTASVRTWSALCVLACLLGTQCKETIVSAPLAVLLVDRILYAESLPSLFRARRALYAGLLLSWVALGLVLASSPRGQTAGLSLGVGPLQSLATQGAVIAHYLRLAAWPHPLSISYDFALAEPLHRYLAEDLAIALLFAAGLFALRRRALAALPWLVFFGVLAPSSSVIPVLGELAAERRMYLPLLALMTLFAGAFAWLCARLPRAQALAPVLVGALALAYGATAAARVHDYRSERALWQQTLDHQPDNPIAMWGLGDALQKAGERQRALALYERMAEGQRPYRGPFSWGTRGLLAASQVYARQGDAARARATMQRAFAHDPQSAVGMLHRAAGLRSEGKPQEALALLQRLLQGPHLHAEAHVLAAQLFRELGDDSLAELHATRAKQLDSTGSARALVRQLVALQ